MLLEENRYNEYAPIWLCNEFYMCARRHNIIPFLLLTQYDDSRNCSGMGDDDDREFASVFVDYAETNKVWG